MEHPFPGFIITVAVVSEGLLGSALIMRQTARKEALRNYHVHTSAGFVLLLLRLRGPRITPFAELLFQLVNIIFLSHHSNNFQHSQQTGERRRCNNASLVARYTTPPRAQQTVRVSMHTKSLTMLN